MYLFKILVRDQIRILQLHNPYHHPGSEQSPSEAFISPTRLITSPGIINRLSLITTLEVMSTGFSPADPAQKPYAFLFSMEKETPLSLL